MGRIEDRYLQGVKDREEAAHAESERCRILCKETYVPQILELGRELLQKLDEADYPSVTATEYNQWSKIMMFVIGHHNEKFYLYSDGTFKIKTTMAYEDLATFYDQVEGRRVYSELSVQKLVKHIEDLRELIARVPSAT